MIDKWNKCTTIEHRRQTERGGAIMANKFKQENVGREELHQNEVIEKTLRLLRKIDDIQLLERIYRFVQYIYIHKM